MKKLGFIAIIMAIVIGIVIYQNPEYRAWFERKSDQILPENVTHTKAYRWRDKNGQWQLSDSPPPGGIDYEIVEYHKDTNVIPSEKLTGKKN
jgi:hypothetical protein